MGTVLNIFCRFGSDFKKVKVGKVFLVCTFVSPDKMSVCVDSDPSSWILSLKKAVILTWLYLIIEVSSSFFQKALQNSPDLRKPLG